MLKLKLPTFTLGTGVNFKFKDKNLSLEKSESIKTWIHLLDQFAYVGLRGPFSAEILNESLKGKTEIVGDTALSVAPETYHRTTKKDIIGICIGHSKEIPITVDVKQYAKTFSLVIEKYIAKGFEIVLLPVFHKDVAFNEALLREIDNTHCRLVVAHDDYEDYLREVAKCTVFIGQKLHGTIAATIMRVPSIMISYHPKCFDYMKSVEMEEWTIPIDTLNKELLEEKILDLFKVEEQVSLMLNRTVTRYSAIQHTRARELQHQLMQNVSYA